MRPCGLPQKLQENELRVETLESRSKANRPSGDNLCPSLQGRPGDSRSAVEKPLYKDQCNTGMGNRDAGEGYCQLQKS